MTKFAFGKEIVDLNKNFEGDLNSNTQKARVLCKSVGGHIEDLFLANPKRNETAVRTKLSLLHWIGNDMKGGNKLFDLFADIVDDFRRLIHPDASFEREHKLAYATRCIGVHAGKHAARITAKNRLLQHQLDTIVWKHYVKGNGKVGRKTLPALDHLIDARTKGRNVIQIIGEGGLGKTKLTIEFIKHCLENNDLRFESVLMLTAKSPEQGEWNTSFSSFRNQEGLLSPRDPTLAFGHYVPDMDYDKVMDYIYDLVDVEKHREDLLMKELQKEIISLFLITLRMLLSQWLRSSMTISLKRSMNYRSANQKSSSQEERPMKMHQDLGCLNCYVSRTVRRSNS